MEANYTAAPASPASGVAGTRASATYAAMALIALGVVLIAGTGFAGADVLHNAAHDARHAFAFPCH